LDNLSCSDNVFFFRLKTQKLKLVEKEKSFEFDVFSSQKNCFSLGVEYRVIASMARNRINMFVLFLYERIRTTIIKYRE
jgi:hypothetical protein